jgi:hypothetical protein
MGSVATARLELERGFNTKPGSTFHQSADRRRPPKYSAAGAAANPSRRPAGKKTARSFPWGRKNSKGKAAATESGFTGVGV